MDGYHAPLWPSFVGWGAVGIVVGGLMIGSQITNDTGPNETMMMIGAVIEAVGLSLFNAGLIGAAVTGRGPQASATHQPQTQLTTPEPSRTPITPSQPSPASPRRPIDPNDKTGPWTSGM
jgi:hypothetical protein